MIRRFCLIILAVLAAVGHADAQKEKLLDSLMGIQESVHDTVLPRLYHDIARAAWSVDPVLGMQYAMMSLEASRSQNNVFYAIKALYVLAINECELEHYSDALRDFSLALQESAEYGDVQLTALLYGSIGNVYLHLDSLDKAESYELISLSKGDSICDNHVMARAFLNLGLVCLKKGRLSQAVMNLDASSKLLRDSLRNMPGRLVQVMDLAGAYMDIGDLASAKDLLVSCMDDGGNAVDAENMCGLWQMLATIYYRMDMQDSALEANKTSMEYAMNLRDVERIELCYRLMDSICIARGDLRMAAEYCRQLIDISDTVFNTTLEERLRKIHYSLDYLDNKRTIEERKRDRQERFYYIMLGAAVLALILLGVMRIVSAKRKTAALHTELDNKKAAITDRVKYAYSIQKAVLPDASKFGTSFYDRFVIFAPRDIVSGDFYWRFSDSRYEILAVSDCTGHGIPGAILTMLGASSLQDIALRGVRSASQILELLRDKVEFMMGQNDEAHVHDGMDMSLMVVDRNTHTLEFAGAYNSLVYIRDGELHTLKATRAPVGYYVKKLPFCSHTLDMEPGDAYYMYTDGFLSQFGGKDHHKYSTKRFLQLLLEVHGLPMNEQKMRLMSEFKEWKGSCDQVDDITVVGLAY